MQQYGVQGHGTQGRNISRKLRDKEGQGGKEVI